MKTLMAMDLPMTKKFNADLTLEIQGQNAAGDYLF
jgi:hypothetical protein